MLELEELTLGTLELDDAEVALLELVGVLLLPLVELPPQAYNELMASANTKRAGVPVSRYMVFAPSG